METALSPRVNYRTRRIKRGSWGRFIDAQRITERVSLDSYSFLSLMRIYRVTLLLRVAPQEESCPKLVEMEGESLQILGYV